MSSNAAVSAQSCRNSDSPICSVQETAMARSTDRDDGVRDEQLQQASTVEA